MTNTAHEKETEKTSTVASWGVQEGWENGVFAKRLSQTERQDGERKKANRFNDLTVSMPFRLYLTAGWEAGCIPVGAKCGEITARHTNAAKWARTTSQAMSLCSLLANTQSSIVDKVAAVTGRQGSCKVTTRFKPTTLACRYLGLFRTRCKE